MNRKLLLITVVTTILACFLATTYSVQTVKASEPIYIRADGSVDPDTVPISSVDNVTYTFTANIYDEIVVERDDIVLDGTGYTLQGTGSGTGVNLAQRSNVTIRNMEIKSFFGGISFWHSKNNTISRNNITANNYGIWHGHFSKNNTIYENRITNIQGIFLFFSSNNNILGNNIIGNNGSGIELWESSNYNTISGNNITANNWHGISISRSSDSNTISGNNITNNGRYGIFLESSDNTLSSNSIAENRYNFGDPRGLNISDLVNYVDSSNTVDGKPIYHWINKQDMVVPSDAGYVALINCTRITVQNLELANNRQGILLAYTTDSTITKNNIANNENGIRLVYSSNNIVYHNNFIDNSEQVYSRNSTNIWDNGYPSGGNYWGDYTGFDMFSGPYQDETGSDEIGDTPYVIDENNKDNYPMGSTWTAAPTVDGEEIPFWMQWWFWTILVIGIMALAGAVYFLKKRKPSTPTAPPLPAEVIQPRARKTMVLLLLGILVLVSIASFLTAGYVYLSMPQTREFTVSYSFPGKGEIRVYQEGRLQDWNAAAEVHRMNYFRQDVFRVADYRPRDIPTDSHYDPVENLYLVFQRKKGSLEAHSLNLAYWTPHLFVFPSDDELDIYLASRWSLEELREKGYYRDFNITFRLIHYPEMSDISLFPNSVPILGLMGTLAGISVMTISLRRMRMAKVEKAHSEITCPSCKKKISEEHCQCPLCGTQLKSD